MIIAIFLSVQFGIIGVITLVERWRHKGPTDWIRNLQAWGVDTAASAFFMVYIAEYHGPALIQGAEVPFALGLLLYLLAKDGTEYFYHVAQHKIGVLWKMHSLHHSDPEMAALTTNRHFWGDQVFKAITIWPFATMLVQPTEPMYTVYAFLTMYNYFIHANLKVNFGKWSWVLNCPAYHRHHHSKLHEHYDTNFAAIFPIFDVIFRTYRRPDGWPPTGQADAPKGIADLVVWPFKKTRNDLPSLEAA